MNQNELLKLLDLTAKPKETTGKVAFQKTTKVTPQKTASETALLVDEWDRSKGEDYHQRSKLKGNLTPLDFTDFHAAAYQGDPQLLESCINPRRQEFIKTLLENPDYKHLHNSTRFNELAAELAATQFGEEFVKLVQKDQQRKDKQKKGSSEKDSNNGEGDLYSAAGKALHQAQGEVNNLEDTMSAFGIGGNGGNPTGTLNTQRLTELFQKVRDNQTLKRICELAGKFRRFAQGKQRLKTTHGYEDMIGITLDDAIDHLLSEELGSILFPELELDTFRRLMEKETLAYDYKGTEKVGKGPIIVCVDESGSMSGEKISHAKAFALTMAWIAQHQKRWCALIAYSGGTEGNLLTLPPNKWDQNALANWLTHFYGGGTTMDVPLEQLPTTYWSKLQCPKGKTDLIIITDGIVNIPQKMEEQFNNWKTKEQVRCISLVLHPTAGDLERVSNELYLIPRIDTDVLAIEQCLSI